MPDNQTCVDIAKKEPLFHTKTPAVSTQNSRSFDAKLQEFL